MPTKYKINNTKKGRRFIEKEVNFKNDISFIDFSLANIIKSMTSIKKLNHKEGEKNICIRIGLTNTEGNDFFISSKFFKTQNEALKDLLAKMDKKRKQFIDRYDEKSQKLIKLNSVVVTVEQ